MDSFQQVPVQRSASEYNGGKYAKTAVHQSAVSSYGNPIPRSAQNVRVRGVVRDILLAFTVSSIPMIAFSALLLGLVFHYQVVPKGPTASSLRSASFTSDPDVIYVDMSATILTTVASWSSTMAPIVLPFILTLVSFPVTRTMIQASRNGHAARQPTPYQLALMLRVLCNASLGSLWSCITYFFTSSKKRAPMASPLTAMTWMLSMASLLSMLVFATDTWLHVKTKTVLLNQFEATVFNNASFGLNDNCTNQTTTFQGGCTLNSAAATTFVIGSEPALQLLANVSSMGMVQQIADKSGRKYAYLGLPRTDDNADLDYTATSLGVYSQCRAITSQCIDGENDISGPSARYNCDFGAMEGRISTTLVDTMILTYFTDSKLQDNNTVSVSLPNPYNFAAVVSVNQNLGHTMDLLDDPEMSSGLHGSTLFVLLCNATVLDWTYTSINGSTTQFSATPSNSSTTNIIMGTQGYTHIGDSYILQRTSLDVFQSSTAQEVADKFAYTYSETALAAIGGAVVTLPAVEAQSRSSMLVARVPKGPLACLLAANMLLVLLGVFLTVAAFVALSDDVGDVQARLSITALVAAHFETNRGEDAVEHIDDMFQEFKGIEGPRVRVERTGVGGWRFTRSNSS